MSFKKITLGNGLRLITVPMKDSLTTTVLVLVEVGTEYEKKEINGISHFLEHMCFKGTKKRPRSLDIAGELDGIGATYNAFTTMEFTGYYAKAQPKRFDAVLDVISDLYLNPVFDAAEIDKERGVIVEEINMHEDTPLMHIPELFTTVLYGDQPAGWEIAGEKEVIRRLTRDDLVAYRSAHYVPQSTVVVLAGAFDEEAALTKVEQAFQPLTVGMKVSKTKTHEYQERPQLLVKRKTSDQTHIAVGVRAFDMFDERRYALQVLSHIVGGGMSSRLFQKVREEMGAAYHINADVDLYTDHGYVVVFAGIQQSKLREVTAAILEEFHHFLETPVEAAELQRAKDHLTGTMMLNLETSDQLASFYGVQEINAQPIMTPYELTEKVQLVTAEQVQSVAREIFQDNRLNMAIIGPVENSDALQGMLKID